MALSPLYLATHTGAQIDNAVKKVYDALGADLEKDIYTLPENGIPKNQLAKEVTDSLAKADTALQEADIATGAANGQIKVKNKQVSVKGLGSAAYTDSTAYDKAGAASTVKTEVIGNADSDKDSSDTINGAKKYADNLNSIMDGRMNTAEGKLATLQGSGAGSVNKALADAKAYTDTEVAKKVASVTAADKSVEITSGTTPTVKVKLDPAAGNALELAENGLRVDIPAAATYSMRKEAGTGEIASVYHLTKTENGKTVDVGAAINIPKEMVVQSGEVVELTAGEAGEGKPAGSYIKLTLQNVDNPLFIYVGDLIEYVTSGSGANDAVQVVVDPSTHKVTASIKTGSLTRDMLNADVQGSLDKADKSVQKSEATGYNDILTKTAAEAAYVKKNGTDRLMTDAEVDKLAGIADGATKTIVDSSFVANSTNPVQSKIVKAELDKKVNAENGKRLMSDAEGTKLNGIADNAQVNVIESVKVNGTALAVANKAVDVVIKRNGTKMTVGADKSINIVTGALADKDKVTKDDLADTLKTEIDNKAENSDLTALEQRVAALEAALSEITTNLGKGNCEIMLVKKATA